METVSDYNLGTSAIILFSVLTLDIDHSTVCDLPDIKHFCKVNFEIVPMGQIPYVSSWDTGQIDSDLGFEQHMMYELPAFGTSSC